MRYKKWTGVDYRHSKGSLTEYNFIGKIWNLRLVFPFGLSIWRNYKQLFRISYPQV